ncbi:MAG: hypothetical protein ACI4O9_02545 [Akkermansia sp.]
MELPRMTRQFNFLIFLKSSIYRKGSLVSTSHVTVPMGVSKFREPGGGFGELVSCWAYIDGVDGGGFVTYQAHGHDLGNTGGVQEGGHTGAERVEGFGVPGAAVATCVFADKSDSMIAHELGELS